MNAISGENLIEASNITEWRFSELWILSSPLKAERNK